MQKGKNVGKNDKWGIKLPHSSERVGNIFGGGYWFSDVSSVQWINLLEDTVEKDGVHATYV